MKITTKFNINDEIFVLFRYDYEDGSQIVTIERYNVDKIVIRNDMKIYYVDTSVCDTYICEEYNLIFKTIQDAQNASNELNTGKTTWEELYGKEKRSKTSKSNISM